MSQREAAEKLGCCVSVLYLGVTVGVVQDKGSLGGLRISTSFVKGLCIVQLVLLHLRVQLCELLVALCSIGEVLDVIVAVTEQRQCCPGLRHRETKCVTLTVVCCDYNTRL